MSRTIAFVLLLLWLGLGHQAYAVGIDDIEDSNNDKHEAVIRCAEISRKIENLEEQGLYKFAKPLYYPLVMAASVAGMTEQEIFNLMRRAYACAFKEKDYNLAEFWSRKLMKLALQFSGKSSHTYAGYLQLHASILRKLGNKETAMAEEYVAERILLSRQVTVLDPNVALTGSVRNHITSIPDITRGPSILSPSGSSVTASSSPDYSAQAANVQASIAQSAETRKNEQHYNSQRPPQVFNSIMSRY
ncbi:MAG: hypothetical protein K2W95_25760 [Candidatus Obscuribacterales bacterium]|nr:hypothetical protein [Candidatus Obscuribacterales bacterium]